MSHIVDRSEAVGIWDGPPESIAYDQEGIAARLRDLSRPCYVIENGRGLGVTTEGQLRPAKTGETTGTAILAVASPLPARRFGDPAFRATYGLDYAYMTGAMANAIASEEMVIALGKARLLGSFGAGGLPPRRLEAAIHAIQAALPDGPYAFNLIHSPNEPALERGAVELYLKHGVRTVEASAYLRLTPHVVRYRAAGLALDADGRIEIRNRIIAKLSRREVAAQFLAPAPPKMLQQLVAAGHITEQQARLAERVPMADDITVEADSGGHTDNRPLVCLLPSIIALRDEMQARHEYARAGAHRRGRRHRHADLGVGRLYDGRGLRRHRLDQPRRRGGGDLGAREEASNAGRRYRCDHGARRRYVRDGRAVAGAQARHPLPYARAEALRTLRELR